MHPINAPIAPEVLDPTPHGRMAGDWSDDDGPATDEYFEAPSHEPLSRDTLPDPTAREALPEPTRMLNRSLTLASADGVNAADAIMILPADINRRVLLLVVTVAGSATGVYVGSAKTDVFGASPLYAANGNIGYDLSGHTGPVWIRNPSTVAADSVTVSVTTVTS